MEVYEIKGLSFSYGDKKVLDNISFTLNEGENLGIIGPNGCGKTTLIKEMTSILPINKGEILLNGKPLTFYSKRNLARNVAVVEQDVKHQLPFTVEEVIAMGRYPWMKPFANLTKKDYEIVTNVLLTFDLWEKRNQSVEALSGGERQLVSLARAMVQEPRILFLDEPTTYLDIGNQLLLMKHVRNWQKNMGVTVVMVLHDLNLAAQYCDRLLLINQKGAVQAVGTVEEVLKEEIIAKIYNIRPTIVKHPKTMIPQVLI
ncbi:MAG: ABC transporter ATP-binding protein [Vulcanibacillus sp.]